MKVLVCGYGLIGAQRVQVLTRHPQVTAITVCDPKLEAGLQLSAKATSATAEAALRGPYDAALIATPHDTAAGLFPEVARAASRLLVEKPLGRNRAETERLLAMAAESRASVFVGLNYRFLKNIQHARRLLASGDLGRVLAVDVVLCHGAQPDYDKSWKTDPARCGGGVCLDPGVHVFDLLCRLFGEVELAGGLLQTGYWPIRVEDHASLSFRLRDRALASVFLSLSSWQSRFEMTIETEGAQLLVRGRGKFYGAQSLTVTAKWPWLHPEDPRECNYNYGLEDSSLTDETNEFVAVAGGASGRNTLATGEEALQAMRLVEACYRLPSAPAGVRQEQGHSQRAGEGTGL
jgi:predicted dehydrogenase